METNPPRRFAQVVKQSWWLLLGLAAILAVVLARPGLPAMQARQAERAFLERQAVALLPEFAADLEKLSGAPRYQIAAEIDPVAGRVEGQAQVTFTNPGPESLNDLVFRLYPNATSLYGGGSLQVQRLTQADQVLSSQVEQGGTALRANLPRPVGPGEKVTVHLNFTAQVPDYPAEGYGIFSRSDQVLALAGWYPILAPYAGGWLAPPVPEVGDALQADTSLYEVELALPAGYEVVSTGVLLEPDGEASITETGEMPGPSASMPATQAVQPGSTRTPGEPSLQHTWRFVSGPAREFALAVSRDFQTLETEVEGVTLRSFSLPVTDPATGPEKSLDLLAGSFQAYLDRLGPYPLAELDLVETPITIDGYEFTGMVFVDGALRAEGEPASYEYILAHEVAHQWWYGLVAGPTVTEPWLDEAHATYSAVLFLEHAGRPEAAQGLLAGWRQELESGEARLLPVDSSTLDFSDWGLYRQAVYTRGALFLDELRQAMGDEDFFAFLRRFQVEYRYEQADTSAYLSLAEEVSGQDLSRIYQRYFISGSP